MKSAPERRRTPKAESKITSKIKYHKTTRKTIVKYTPIVFAIILITILAVCVMTYNNWKKIRYAITITPTENITSGICLTDSDCFIGQACKNVSIIGENVASSYKMCMNK